MRIGAKAKRDVLRMPGLREHDRVQLMGKINSREKGAQGERELARLLREYGYKTRRGQQYSGANGDADVVGLPGIHIECKRVETAHVYKWLEQAKRDAREGELPAVFHRQNKKNWIVVMELDDFMSVYMKTDINDEK